MRAVDISLGEQGRAGVVQDTKEPWPLLRKAAEQGHASAQYNLGLMYANGQGIPQDYVMAHKYFNIAASIGVKKRIKIEIVLPR